MSIFNCALASTKENIEYILHRQLIKCRFINSMSLDDIEVIKRFDYGHDSTVIIPPVTVCLQQRFHKSSLHLVPRCLSISASGSIFIYIFFIYRCILLSMVCYASISSLVAGWSNYTRIIKMNNDGLRDPNYRIYKT